MRILMILVPDGADRPVLKLRQVAEPYYLFRDIGAEVVLASLAGGAPISTSDKKDATVAVKRLRRDLFAQDALADTISLHQVSATDFQAAFVIGACEVIEADPNHAVSSIVAQMLESGKPVAMLSDSSGLRLLITGNAPGPAAKALLSILRG